MTPEGPAQLSLLQPVVLVGSSSPQQVGLVVECEPPPPTVAAKATPDRSPLLFSATDGEQAVMRYVP